MKRTVAFLLALLLVISICPLSAVATDESGAFGHLTWTLDEGGTLTISGEGDMPDIPDYPDPITDTLWKYSKVKTVIIEYGITSVGQAVFIGARYNKCCDARYCYSYQGAGIS